jgi:predicted GNAT family N-acyltransferase
MNIKVTSFEESGEDIRCVRDVVFGMEQKVRRELDWDGNDPHCAHVVAVDNGGNPIGTGRMQPDGRIGRLAVLKQWRNRGIGSGMLEALVETARRNGLEKVYLHAQVHAVPFYEKNGFDRDGDEFMEAGIRHMNMTRNTLSAHRDTSPEGQPPVP